MQPHSEAMSGVNETFIEIFASLSFNMLSRKEYKA